MSASNTFFCYFCYFDAFIYKLREEEGQDLCLIMHVCYALEKWGLFTLEDILITVAMYIVL